MSNLFKQIHVYSNIDLYLDDISDCVLDVGNFPVILNNYDHTLMFCETDAKFSLLMLEKHPNVSIDTIIEIRQDDKILMPFYITSFIENTEDYTIDVKLVSVYEKLKKAILQEDWQNLLLNNVNHISDVTLGTSGSEKTNLYLFSDLISYVFRELTGYVLNCYIDYANSYVSDAILWNFGLDEVSSSISERNPADYGTWFELLEIFCIAGYTLSFTNNSFVLARFLSDTGDAFPLPVRRYEEEVESNIDFVKAIEVIWSEMSTSSMYKYKSPTAQILDLPMQWSSNVYGTPRNESIDISYKNAPPFVGYRSDLNFCFHAFSIPLFKDTRFGKKRTLTTIDCDLITDFVYYDSNDFAYYYPNLNMAECHNVDGMYFSIIEIRDKD